MIPLSLSVFISQSPTVKKQKIGDDESSSQDLKDSKKGDDESNSDSTACPSTPVSGITATEKQTSENGEIGDEAKKSRSGSKSKKKKIMDLPRRSSKRLAGVTLDPAPELQVNRTRKPVANQSGDEPTSTVAEVVDVAVDPKPEVRTTRARKAVAKQQAGDERSNITVTLNPTPASKTATGARRVAKQSSNTKQSSNKAAAHLAEGPKSTEVSQYSSMSNKRYGDSANLNKNSGKFEGKQERGKNQEVASALPSQEPQKTETGYAADSLDLPFGDLFSDPCIAFAIKTLTGDNIDTSAGGIESSSIGPSSNNIFNIVDQSQNQNQNHLAIPVQHAGNNHNIIDNISKPEEKPGVPIESSLADIFTDPCIEFAIKTLTGSIPVVADETLDYFSPPQQQNLPLPLPLPPQTQSFCQSEFLSQQYNILEKPVVMRDQSGHSRSLNLQKSNGAAGIRQPGDNRFNECH